MKTISTLTQHRNIIGYIFIVSISSILLGIIISTFSDYSIAVLLTVLSLILSIILFFRPTWLYYFFMLFFVFGEVSVGQYFIQPSLSNGFGILALIIIIFYGLLGKRIYALIQSPRQKKLFLGLIAILFIEILSAILNNSFRPIATRLSHVISLLFFLLIVRDKLTLWRGFYLGVISVGILSSLTILAGLNLNPIGYRAPISWGSTPWEEYIHRAIGLPNMQGGLHSIYILAFLPLAILLVTSGSRLKINRWIKIVCVLTVILGILALLIASYRSGWIGLIVSLFCLVLFYNRFLHISNFSKIFIFIFIAGIFILIFILFSKSIYTTLYNLIFIIRSQGVEARLIQFQYIFSRMLSPSIHQVLGYGYEDFGSSFMVYVGRQGLNNPELYPWIHNYYLGLLYASGWSGFFLFFFYLFYVMRNLYQQAASTDYEIRIINSAIFSSLAGILTVLLFTAETSGLYIVWILIAASAFNHQLNSIQLSSVNMILR
jgi:hypothetical protein